MMEENKDTVKDVDFGLQTQKKVDGTFLQLMKDLKKCWKKKTK